MTMEELTHLISNGKEFLEFVQAANADMRPEVFSSAVLVRDQFNQRLKLLTSFLEVWRPRLQRTYDLSLLVEEVNRITSNQNRFTIKDVKGQQVFRSKVYL